MTLAKTERVAGCNFGAAMGRPRRPALGPAAPLARSVGVPVRLVGEAARPPARARVVGEGRVDLVNYAGPGSDRGTAPAELTGRGEGHRALATTSWPWGRALGAKRGALVAVPGPAGPAVVTKTFILLVGSAQRP